MEEMMGYIKIRTVISDLFGAMVKIVAFGVVMTIIMNPEEVATWIKVIRTGFGG